MEPDASVSQESLGILLATVLLGACILFLYIRKLLGSASKTDESQGDQQSAAQGKDPVTYGQADSQKSKKRLEKSSRETKSTFSHSWLFTSLKGHIGRVLDLDFSPNGKWIATCADDMTAESGRVEVQSSSRDREQTITTREPGRKKQKRKRAKQKQDSEMKKEVHLSCPAFRAKPMQEQTLKMYQTLHCTNGQLYNLMKNYLVKSQQLQVLGFPFRGCQNPKDAYVYIVHKKKVASAPAEDSDSEFSASSDIKSESLAADALAELSSALKSPQSSESSTEKLCVRCHMPFHVTSKGEYITHDPCVYHWGRLMNADRRGYAPRFYSCCKGGVSSEGCAQCDLHVWTGIQPGLNGPYDGFVSTQPARFIPADGNYGIYALDCEMYFTAKGLQLAKVTVLDLRGKLVYEKLVCSDDYVVDYNTRFSGITARHLEGVTQTLEDIQQELLTFIHAESILIGHGVENDLRALRVIHNNVVDTSMLFPHFLGFPYRRSLKSLARSVLRKKIQANSEGHDSHEDALISLELVLSQLRSDLLTSRSPQTSLLPVNHQATPTIAQDLDQKDHKSIRANVEYDHAVKVKWSPDSKAFIVFKAQEGVVEVYKVSKKPDSKLGDFQVALTFPKKHEGDCVGLGIACDGKYIMTCSNRNDLVIWDLKGEVLAQQDTHQVDTYSALISPCGRFVATSGFTPDVKVWEVKFTRTGEFSGLVRAFELKGHNSGVYSFGFNTDSTKAATVSKDGTWKLYDTNIEYEKGQEPHLISTNKYESQPGEKTLLALSPDGRTVAITSGNDLLLFSAISGNLEKRISNIHTGGIMAVMFDPSNKLVLTAGDRQVRMFHNVVGYKATIEELEGKRKTATTVAMRERIIQQISEAKAFLQSLQ
ncbi:unnamed protein product [Darwinula stevensoni]|uniref:Exonuclease domain-containing protein n=1 Tax=Darwinula stevensoni TaxID=69355 RepID=A0A7R9A5E1_9CRUS|nr:unnamed protein product [Darwinula stevensoni]CAG0886288.1 unnamed protein product [Darwinula stevensoni]